MMAGNRDPGNQSEGQNCIIRGNELCTAHSKGDKTRMLALSYAFTFPTVNSVVFVLSCFCIKCLFENISLIVSQET